MDDFTLKIEKVFDGEQWHFCQAVSISSGRIQSITPLDKSDENFARKTLIPGLIDLQVNGGGGQLFNANPSQDTIKAIGEAHRQFGTTAWLPTLITDSIEKMHQAADAVASAIAYEVPGVLGIHFEGPHLSTSKKGVHSENYIRQLSDQEMAVFKRSDLGKVLVTLAPENVAPDVIKSLVDLGVHVCLGHSNADYETTCKAIEAGADGFTHLFNAMSPFTSREPGMVGAALLHDDTFPGIILDGIHVNPESARLAFRQNKNLMLVTDAMPPVGADQKEFEFFGSKVTRSGITLTDTEGRLAGSALDMMSAVRNAMEFLKIELSDAVTLASRNPARYLNLESQYGHLRAGANANMCLIDSNNQITDVWVDGKQLVCSVN